MAKIEIRTIAEVWLRPIFYISWRMARIFVATANWLSRVAGAISGALIVLLMFVVTYEVVMRHFLHRPTLWAFETSMYLALLLVFLPAAYILQHERHIQITVVMQRLSGRAQTIAYLLASCLGLIFCMLLTKQGWNVAWFSYEIRHLSDIMDWPLFLPKLLIPIGGGLLSLQFIIHFAKYIRALATKGSINV